ncbi:MAG: enoyl-CoA hydratase-related protein [Cytophagales bacterium]|jgi:enoyl-CoA hydratase|nr:enoyl-CoA hydratase-related protein [Cytophagales bacterium]
MDFVKVTKAAKPYVALVELNRPKELNALNSQLLHELRNAMQELDRDEAVRAIVITGNARAFAAGADIKEMADKTAVEMMTYKQSGVWGDLKKIAKPVVAAVSGFCLGGGCELAMTCDIIVAAESAQFGQPEIKLGILPGAGGTQRLTHAVGKARAMDLILTGRFFSAAEAERWGLVSRIVPDDTYLAEALHLAETIAQMPPVAVRLAKESVNAAFELPLTEGLQLETKNAALLFSTEDQKEGMKAFVEKRKANFVGK